MEEKEKELATLVNLLHEAGIEKEKADDLVIDIVKESSEKGISVIKALREFADGGAREESVRFQLCIALNNINEIKLKKLTTLY